MIMCDDCPQLSEIPVKNVKTETRKKKDIYRDIWLNVAILFLLCAYLILILKVME